jgi:hypothetical protein
VHPDIDRDVVAFIHIEGRFNFRGGEVEGSQDGFEMKPPAAAGLLGPIKRFLEAKDFPFQVGEDFGGRFDIDFFLDWDVEISGTNIKRLGGVTLLDGYRE